jgi:hypothetical protein
MSADEHVKAQLTPEGKFALLLMLSEVVVFAVALFFNQPEVGLSACISVAIFLIVLRATWKLREHGWYWGAVVVAVALQIPFFLYVPWSNHTYRGTALIGLGFVDFIVLWGGIKLCEKLFSQA